MWPRAFTNTKLWEHCIVASLIHMYIQVNIHMKNAHCTNAHLKKKRRKKKTHKPNPKKPACWVNCAEPPHTLLAPCSLWRSRASGLWAWSTSSSIAERNSSASAGSPPSHSSARGHRRSEEEEKKGTLAHSSWSSSSSFGRQRDISFHCVANMSVFDGESQWEAAGQVSVEPVC